MGHLRFEGRDLKTYAEFVAASELIEGKVYFLVHYLDEMTLIPTLWSLVFIGRNLSPDDAGRLYFQDTASFMGGQRFGSATGDSDAEFHTVDEKTPFVLEFENALDLLLLCSLHRREAKI